MVLPKRAVAKGFGFVLFSGWLTCGTASYTVIVEGGVAALGFLLSHMNAFNGNDAFMISQFHYVYIWNSYVA